MTARKRVAVIGGGWAGSAAAVQATADGHAVTLFEMAGQAGGRARSVPIGALALDNGQHMLIGAYRETLRLMQQVGVDAARALRRHPLTVRYPDGSGLRLPPGNARAAFAWAVIRARGWTWPERWALLRQASNWLRHGMRNPGVDTVEQLCSTLPARVRRDLIDPLCIAALNTPSSDADATVFLRVLADALFGGAGCSDLLLPAIGLSQLFPEPALRWLQRRNATIRLKRRVLAMTPRDDATWLVDGEPFEEVVLACSAVEAARLAATVNPAWSRSAEAFRYEPIATVYVRRAHPLPTPMLALHSDGERPAQFVFDLGLLGQHADLAAFVVSGARLWLERSLTALATAVQQQAATDLRRWFDTPPEVIHTAMERRATFACVPALVRPAQSVAPGLWAAGDYVDGPYPATIEGAVRSGVQAARALNGG